MYLDLRSKLKMYQSGQDREAKSGTSNRGAGCDLGGFTASTPEGDCYVIEKEYPGTYIYGGFSLEALFKTRISAFGKVCPGLGEGIRPEELLFLDTETTGLSGGAGTVIFLLGAGFFREDRFYVRQFFMRDYDEEPALLEAFNSLLKKFSGIVTFNGKAFDWNIIKSRFAFNRMRLAAEEPVHIDLLYPSRRIWKLKLSSCRLGALEESVLGETRIGDIPSEMVPSAYFRYLETGDVSEIKRVISHNERDILSLVSLFTRIGSLLDNPLGEAECEEELMGVGGIFAKDRDYGKVVRCFEPCARSGKTAIRNQALKGLAEVYKRQGNYREAVRCWEEILKEGKPRPLYPAVELAKFYEHKAKDFFAAIELVREALSSAVELGLVGSSAYAELKKRHERLLRKIKRGENGERGNGQNYGPGYGEDSQGISYRDE